MKCAECNQEVHADTDYLCVLCRDKAMPLPAMQETIARIIDMIRQLNENTDGYTDLFNDTYGGPGRVVVVVESDNNSPWTLIKVGYMESPPSASYLATYIFRPEREFGVWHNSGDVYEIKYGEAQDDPIPEQEYRARFTI